MATTKKCTILRRYFVKSSGSICTIIRNGENKEYTCCLHRNGLTSCTCKAGSRGVTCYHVRHLKATEAQRNPENRMLVSPLVRNVLADTDESSTVQQDAPTTTQNAPVNVAPVNDTQLPLARVHSSVSQPSSSEMALAAMGLMHGQAERRGGWLPMAGARSSR